MPDNRGGPPASNGFQPDLISIFGPPVITSAAATSGAFALPAGTKDAAVVLTLAPGAYTALVSGADGSTGVALVEVYELP